MVTVEMFFISFFEIAKRNDEKGLADASDSVSENNR